MAEAPTVLSLRGICKSYAGPVLSEVDLDLRAGEVHALVGENGAGKSTLCRIIAGLVRADAGGMKLWGSSPTTSLRKRGSMRVSIPIPPHVRWMPGGTPSKR